MTGKEFADRLLRPPPSKRPRRPAASRLSDAEELIRLRRERRGVQLAEAARIRPSRILRMALSTCQTDREVRVLLQEYRKAPHLVAVRRGAVRLRETIRDGKTFAAAVLRRSR